MNNSLRAAASYEGSGSAECSAQEGDGGRSFAVRTASYVHTLRALQRSQLFLGQALPAGSCSVLYDGKPAGCYYDPCPASNPVPARVDTVPNDKDKACNAPDNIITFPCFLYCVVSGEQHHLLPILRGEPPALPARCAACWHGGAW